MNDVPCDEMQMLIIGMTSRPQIEHGANFYKKKDKQTKQEVQR